MLDLLDTRYRDRYTNLTLEATPFCPSRYVVLQKKARGVEDAGTGAFGDIFIGDSDIYGIYSSNQGEINKPKFESFYLFFALLISWTKFGC